MIGSLALALLLAAQPIECPFAGQKPMLIVRLYFGQSGAPAIPGAEWRTFLANTVTPRFPGGFTVYDGAGQWQDANSPKIIREKTKIIEIATEDTPAIHEGIAEISRRYRERFHQEAVGIVTTAGCAAF